MSEENRSTHKLYEKEKIGEVQIADEVVAIIAGLAATEVEGVDSIEQADLLRNRVLYASRQDFKLEPGRYFIQDLLGIKAVDADSGRDYGAVTDVLKTGANDVYEITGDDGKAYLLPAIPMTVIEIRLEEGLMRIRPIEGIFDHED